MTKPYTVENEATATAADWLACYGHTIKVNPYDWTQNMPPDLAQAICEPFTKRHREANAANDARIVAKLRARLQLYRTLPAPKSTTVVDSAILQAAKAAAKVKPAKPDRAPILSAIDSIRAGTVSSARTAR